jgi:putative transposase
VLPLPGLGGPARSSRSPARRVFVTLARAPPDVRSRDAPVAADRGRGRTEGNEMPLRSWSQLQASDPLGARAMEQMVLGVATRKYARSLEGVPEGVEERGTSKSAVSRRFVEATAAKLTEWMSRSLGELDVCAVFIDGLHFAEHVVLVALGVDAHGTKHVLGLWEGAAENTASCKALLDNLVTRGLDPKRKRLFVIDGSGGLRAAIRDVFGKRALVQRCQKHKMENVVSHLPKAKHAAVRTAMRQAYKSTRVETAKRLLNNLIEASRPRCARASMKRSR